MTRTGSLTKEQTVLHNYGRIGVARSAADAVRIVRASECLAFGRIYGGKGEVL